MKNVIRANGIRKAVMDYLTEWNGFHEVTEREIGFVTQPEWKAILSKHYPHLDLDNKNVSVDLENETIILD
jgi:hypothetical protein